MEAKIVDKGYGLELLFGVAWGNLDCEIYLSGGDLRDLIDLIKWLESNSLFCYRI
ncbi:hypothetical protein [Helicobacter sp. 16-1353]|uniref:hypothetical protein n=1 Tax=Helicobacter sp. 16-1353 TaxID=2004996 RepID=UPI0015EF9E2C|nr:hypothetical protein [Helicobacter sp. 16-1353]